MDGVKQSTRACVETKEEGFISGLGFGYILYLLKNRIRRMNKMCVFQVAIFFWSVHVAALLLTSVLLAYHVR